MKPSYLGCLAGLLLACFVLASSDGKEPNAFEEDFTHGLTRWDVLDPNTWHHHTNGTVEITARKSDYKPPHRSPFHLAILKDLQLCSGSIEFRVKSTLDTGDHRDCCVVFGWQDPAHFYYVHFGARPDKVSGQIHIVDGADRRPLTENKNPVPWTDDWHTVRLERDHATGRIAAYFDGKLIVETTDTTFGEGRVGIGSFDDCDAFDWVRVETAR